MIGLGFKYLTWRSDKLSKLKALIARVCLTLKTVHLERVSWRIKFFWLLKAQRNPMKSG
jgi:hypothetical protein